MALNYRDFLTKNAEAFAAGRVLGFTDDQVLARLEQLSRERNIESGQKLNEEYIDDVIKGKFDNLGDSKPTAQSLLRDARRQVNAARRKQAYKKGEAPSVQLRQQGMEEALQSALRSDIALERAIREDPTTILPDDKVLMPEVVGGLPDGEYEDGEVFYGRQNDDESAFTRVRNAGSGEYDEQGVKDPTVDPLQEAAIRRNTFKIGEKPDGTPIYKTFREDEPIPESLRNASVQAQPMKETYADGHPSLNRRVAGSFDEG